MYLKQIELENFKSFGKKLTVPLLEGYTAVTGPNGSGKSNISDSILFVLGPKSSKAIRAGKLSDLIFNGGNNKNPAKYCKVSLVFDNTDRTIPIDEEIVRLTRMIKMSADGEGYTSYFYVNDRKSSLSEFDMLLSNARISADGYNLVQQGDVTRIVTMSNVERRKILDNISGIAKFDEELNKASAEREEANANIERISIILNEIMAQMRQLEKEKENALKYMELEEKLTLSKAKLAKRRKENTLVEIRSLRDQIETFNKQIEDGKLKKSEIFGKINEIEESIVQIEEELESKGGEEFKELQKKIDVLKIQVARMEDKVATSAQTVAELEESIVEIDEEHDEMSQEVSELKSQLEKNKNEYASEEEKLAKSKKELEETQNKISACDEQLADLDKEINEKEALVRESDRVLNSMKMEMERLVSRENRFDSDIAEATERVNSLDFEVKEIDWKIKEIKDGEKTSEKDFRELQERLMAKRSAETRLMRESDELEQAVKSLTRELTRIKAEEEAAGDVARGYNRAVRAILDARDSLKIRGVHGTIAELAEVDPAYQTALNIAAGNRMQAIVVDDDQTAAECIQYLKNNRSGRATFLPLTKMLDGRPRGKAIMAAKDAVGFAIDLVKFDEQYRAAFWYVLGDTVVVDTLDQARKLMGGVRLVTAGGELLEASGAMVGGNVEQSNLKFGSSSKGKKEEISQQLEKALLASENLSVELKDLRDEILDLERQLHTITGADKSSSITLETLEKQRRQLKERYDQGVEQKKEKEIEKQKISSEISELSVKIESHEVTLNGMKESLEAARAKMEEIAPRELSDRLKLLQAQTSDLAVNMASLKAEIDTLTATIRMTERRLKDLEEEKLQTLSKIETVKSEGKTAAEEAEKAKVELTALRMIEESMGNEINVLRKKRDDLFKQKVRLGSEKDKISADIETAEGMIININTRIGQCQDSIRELEEELQGYNIDLTDEFLPTIESLKEIIRQCERAMNAMGAVNLRALEDYSERKNRYDELDDEIKRLGAQRDDLLKLEMELGDKKKVALMKVYEGVNVNFKQAYSELSQGGDADLILEDPENPFEGGLSIKVKPKQGKVLRLDALSGGEKSLTALAFIFAIQEYQPSPFYLLDEVDMFLDGINADMVAKRVQKSSKTAQFVQISLRKITLTKADHIIGVTKQGGGISNVIVRPNISGIEDFQKEFGISDEKEEGST